MENLYYSCMGIDATFLCAYCFRPNDVVVDPSGGIEQEDIEDCQVCCRPNKLHITLEPGRSTAAVAAEPA